MPIGMKSPRVSIVIRARNEAKWIWRCLLGLKQQSKPVHEIIVVDNDSSDQTVEIASKFGVEKILSISDYTPGKALNLGFAEASGDLVSVISAHCLPSDEHWLDRLILPLGVHADIGAAYGRQIPLPFSNDQDKADLYAVYRAESKIQRIDGFFNNANSVVPRHVWETLPFDESVTNVEDRVWGQSLIESGLAIAYVADAAVFHHNGMHRSTTRRDQKPTVSILEDRVLETSNFKIDRYSELFRGRIAPFLVSEASKEPVLLEEIRQFSALLSRHEWGEYRVLSDLDCNHPNVVSRSAIGLRESDSVLELIQNLAKFIKQEQPESQYLGFFVARMGFPEEYLLNGLVSGIVKEGADFSFIASREFSHLWHFDGETELKQLDSSLAPRSERQPSFLARYGEGSIFAISNCLSGDLFNGPAALVERRAE